MSRTEPAPHPEAPIEITEAAARAIISRAERDGCAGAPMRIKIQGGGCSGVTYKMTYETRDLPPGDFVRTEHGKGTEGTHAQAQTWKAVEVRQWKTEKAVPVYPKN